MDDSMAKQCDSQNKTSSTTTVKTDDLAKYVVAYIDLLGQRELLNKIEPLCPQNRKQEEELKKAAGNAIRVIRDLHNRFKTYFSESTAQHIPSWLLPQQVKVYMELMASKIGSQGFSDGLILFISLRDPVQRGSIFDFLRACGSLCLCQLASGHPVRIGVDLHFGVELEECGLYGPALANAYELESKIAQYPRVVVGDQVIWYLHRCLEVTANLDPQDYKGAYRRNLCVCCTEMLAQDSDGYPIVDYLGPGFRKYGAHKLNKAHILPVYKFVKAEAARYASDEKLAPRYSMLLDYFEKRLSLWD